MDSPQSFWLIVINETSTASVSLVELDDNYHYHPSSFGPETEWNSGDPDSLVSAIDVSLSTAATDAQLPPDSEPEYGAFILSPYWIGPDGKILPQFLKLIENVCRQLDLKPMGFISYDEAIVEAANTKEGYPVSFVLTNLSPGMLTLTLVHLGKIKSRLQKNYLGDFESKYLEEALVELNSEAALPPEIVVFGLINDNVIFDLKNYSWTGKKNIETFLHFPEVKAYNREELSQVYIKAISSPALDPQLSSGPKSEPKSEPKPEPEPEIEPEPEPAPPLTEVTASELGFTAADSPVPVEVTPPPPLKPKFSLPKIKLPAFHFRFRLPHLQLKFSAFIFWPIAFIPLIILGLLLTAKADITIHLNPYEFNRQFQVNLAPDKELSLSAKTVPIEIKTVEVEVKDSLPTTGEKTVGEKAKGEIEIYNKSDKPQSLPRGTILIDSSGKKFELPNSVQVASSSSNLNVDPPVIILGQTKTVVSATDFGPEYNLAKDTRLDVKDNSLLMAKVVDGLSGGSKEKVKAVSTTDRKNLETKITQTATASVKNKIESDLKNQTGLIADSIKISHQRLDFSREVGESADELSVSAKSKATAFVLTESTKTKLISVFLADDPNFSVAQISPDQFTLNFKSIKISGNTATATLDLVGKSLPSLNLSTLKKQIQGRFLPQAKKKISSFHSRIYRTDITTRYSFLGNLLPLPLRLSQIFLRLEP